MKPTNNDFLMTSLIFHSRISRVKLSKYISSLRERWLLANLLCLSRMIPCQNWDKLSRSALSIPTGGHHNYIPKCYRHISIHVVLINICVGLRCSIIDSWLSSYSAITCSSGVVIRRGAPELVGHPVAKEDGKTQHNDLYRENKPWH